MMVVYLNDLSFAGCNKLLDDWQKVLDFASFIKNLTDVTIIAPHNVWSIPIGGYTVNTRKNIDGSTVPDEHHKFLYQVFKRFIPQTIGEPFFSMCPNMSFASSSVGMAAEVARPVISIILETKFKSATIQGWLKSAGKKVINTSVQNLYDGVGGDSFIYLADLSKCATIDPTTNPMWNLDVSSLVLQDINFINISKDERRQLLLKYGKLVAEINGWTYNKQVSDLNSKNGHPRYIYDSGSKFTGYRKVFLSIDQEGPEVCYELCDTNGSHLGEVSWDGKWKPAEVDHSIRVR